MTYEEAREILLKMAFAESTDFAEDRLFAFGYSDEHEALNIAIEALEKQIAKKPIKKMVTRKWLYLRQIIQFWTCPTCNKVVEVDDNEGFQTEYYPSCECGQRIDWTGILEDYELKWNDYEVVE